MKPNGGVLDYLDRCAIPYELFPHPPTRTLAEAARHVGVAPERLARALLLETEQRPLLAVLPASTLIDFASTEEITGHPVLPAHESRVRRLFTDCEPGSLPPFGAPYGVPTLADERLAALPEVYFEPGSREVLVRVQGDAFARLLAEAQWGDIAREPALLAGHDSSEFVIPHGLERAYDLRRLRPRREMKEEVLRVETLPVLPEAARHLLWLLNNPRATVPELVAAVEDDPGLAAQVVRYARSPLFGEPQAVESVRDAVERTLGADLVINLALGLAAGGAFHDQHEGPLGPHAHWRDALYAATLSQSLARELPPALRIKPGLAYLAGLLHNVGFLVIGHLYKAEFFLLNRLVAANPQVPVALIEKRLLGTDHTRIGAWLMAAWQMPPEVVAAVRSHHNEYARESYARYANLVLLVDHLLRPFGHGDAAEAIPPAVVLNALGVDLARAEALTRQVVASGAGLDPLVRQLAS